VSQGTGLTPIELAERSPDGSIGSWLQELLQARLDEIGPSEAAEHKSIHEPNPSSIGAELFSLGEEVVARYFGGEWWHEGSILKIHYPVNHVAGDAAGVMYDVAFGDGVVEKLVLGSFIKKKDCAFSVGEAVRFVTERLDGGDAKSWNRAVITREHCDGTYGKYTDIGISRISSIPSIKTCFCVCLYV